ncbi:YlbL family protein [Microbacterium sp. GXF7504]
MTLFDDTAPVAPAPRRPMRRGTRVGMWALVVALVALLGISFLPTGFVIQQPGPVYDTIGAVDTGEDGPEPLLSIPDAETYPTAGSLDLLTVQVVGSPTRAVSWLEVVGAWFDRTRAVVPLETVFPAGQTNEQREQQNAVQMTDSQIEAQAAAFAHLGYDVHPAVAVVDVVADGPADGVLEPEDVIVSVDGEQVGGVTALRAAVTAKDGDPVTLGVLRGDEELQVEVEPVPGDGGAWLLGITASDEFELPYEVEFALRNVGGPSAGMMFTLGIIDLLTPGELTGGETFAGTGTISVDGTVGAIGGIRQKLWGAVDAGADWFLAPQDNCDEVVGHVPDGLRVFAVADLDDALTAVETVAAGGDLDALPTCTVG